MKASWIAACVLAVLVSGAALSPCLRNGFTNFDDTEYVTANPMIRSLSGPSLRAMASSFYFCNYQPLTLASYALDYRRAGLDPRAYHFTNWVLHLANVALVFWLVLLLSGRGEAAAVAALLFGAHPLHVESVAWVAERKDVLSTLFYLGTLIGYVRYRARPSRTLYAATLLAMTAGLLAKSMLVSVPAALLLVDLLQGRRWERGLWIEKIPHFALAALFAVLAYQAQRMNGAVQTKVSLDVVERLAVPAYGVLFYLEKLVNPTGLSSFYPYPDDLRELATGGLFLGLAVFLLIVALPVYSSALRRPALFGLGFFLVALAPVSQIVPIGAAVAADRYTYVPSFGLFYLAGHAYALLRDKAHGARWKGPALTALAGAVVVLLSVMTWRRCAVWRDGVTLWGDVAKRYPRTAGVQAGLGEASFLKGDHDGAIAAFTRGLESLTSASARRSNNEISYNRAQLLNGRGCAHFKKGDIPAALADLEAAMASSPRYAQAYGSRGAIRLQQGEVQKAEQDFSRAIELEPEKSAAYKSRGVLYFQTGDLERALADFNDAIRLDALDADAYGSRAVVLDRRGDSAAALADLSRAALLDSRSATARQNLEFARRRLRPGPSS